MDSSNYSQFRKQRILTLEILASIIVEMGFIGKPVH